MREAIAISMASALAVGGAAACAPEQPPGPDPDMVAAGKQLFDRNGCATCHGTDGSGRGPNAAYMDPPPRDYRDPGSYRSGTDIDSVARSIAEGFVGAGGGMPAFSHLSEERRRQIGAFVVSLQRPDGDHLEVEAPWIAESLPSVDRTAGYLRIVSGRDDALVGAEVVGARRVEIHQTTDDEGMTAMERLERVEVPSRGGLELAPGGIHLMLIDTAGPLAAGSEVQLTLFFESRTAKRLRVPVRRRDAGG